MVLFLVDTGSALTILRRDTWEKCKKPGQQLVPWHQSKLVGAEGSQLHVFGSALITLNLEGEIFELSVVVIDPLTSEAILGLDVLAQCTVNLLHGHLITGAGHVVNMCCQQQSTEWKTSLVDGCGCQTLNNNMSTGHSEDVESTGQLNTLHNNMSTGHSKDIESTGPLKTLNNNMSTSPSEDVELTGQLGDVKPAGFPSHEQEEDNSILQPGTPDFGSVEEPQSKEVVVSAQGSIVKADRVLSVNIIDNVRIPSFSELEILAQTKSDGTTSDGNRSYMLESNLQNSDLLVARAIVTLGETVPVRLLNPTGSSINLYSGARVAVLSEVMKIEDNRLEDMNDAVAVSSVSDSNKDTVLEDMLMEIVKGTSLSSHHQDLLLTLLLDYSDVFARSKDELGRTDLLQHEIVIDSAAPIRQRFRRLSPEKRVEMRALLDDMLQKNLISPSKSPWAAPIVLVKKKDGTSRFCVDYRRINAVTRKDAYPLPRVDDILETLAGSQLFSTLDLASGYWQVEVKPEDREKTAFITSEGLYEFNVLPFGLCNGPATFQRLMNILLAGVQWHDCLVYLDDIIVLGRSFGEHLQNLAKVFQRLRQANLKLQVKKCVFGRDTVKFLGHIISSKGISTDPEKVARVSQWPVPINKLELQQFLGFVNYYRRFIKDCASISKPLYQLTEHTRQFKWTDQCQEAFLTLRKALVSAPVLAFPDCSRMFILDTDASNQGIGAVLSQQHDDGLEHVVAYASRVLSKAERRYSVTRKEMLAVVSFLHHFRPYLLGRRFKLRTDHGSLLWLRSFKEPEGQLARWLEQLEEYDFDVVHRQGKLHVNADVLSRLTHTEGESDVLIDSIVPVVANTSFVFSHLDVRAEQLRDNLVGPFLLRRKVIKYHLLVVEPNGVEWLSFGISSLLRMGLYIGNFMFWTVLAV